MTVRNIGCIGSEGITVALDDVVCIVGRNNSGKSTILRAYELAQGAEAFDWSKDRYANAEENNPSEIILEVHIPDGLANIDEKWKESRGDLRIVTSRWQWRMDHQEGKKPKRETKAPGQDLAINDGYALENKAGGADNVFKSRLPQPVRIGSRSDPVEAEKALMKLVLEPVGTALTAATSDLSTSIGQAVEMLEKGVATVVGEQTDRFSDAISEVHKGFTGVFPELAISLDVQAAPPKFDAAKLITDGSGLRVTDRGVDVRLSQQGAGAQRALFWTMLQVRNRLDADKKVRESKIKELEKAEEKAKDDDSRDVIRAQISSILAGGALPEDVNDPAFPGYILLIDEPENALHPLAARAAQRQLYELASQPEWQVMMTTHSPLFVNPAVDHTTIVRLERDGDDGRFRPNLFRTDDAGFSGDDKQVLQAIQEMDPTFCEVFFGTFPIIVEGNTEHAAFIAAVVEAGHELVDHMSIIKARGKPQIAAVMKMLIHFRKDFAVLHDSDWPLGTKKKQDGTYVKSPSWTQNFNIYELVHEARLRGIGVAHQVSIPDFERRIGLPRGTGGKPFEAYEAIRSSPEIKSEVQELLESLKKIEKYDITRELPPLDIEGFQESLRVSLRARVKANIDDDGYRLGE
ncbi:ATP-dependent nuclease [Roseinatronobacter sp. NSM]|uniref:ATP-dependent nuclease n=1 Tax=Roseinatronobacter sp. NSM TaxID=3457785 RepID=UPI004034FA63